MWYLTNVINLVYIEYMTDEFWFYMVTMVIKVMVEINTNTMKLLRE